MMQRSYGRGRYGAVLASLALFTGLLASQGNAFVPPIGSNNVLRSAGRIGDGGFTVKSPRSMNVGNTAGASGKKHRHGDHLLTMKMWGDEGDIVGQDRIKSCIPYLLPLADGHHFGKYIFLNFPALRAVDEVTIAPLAHFLDSVPFLSLIVFLVLSLGTRNSDMARGVRFNAQQAILVDIALIFPELIGSGMDGVAMPTVLMASASNFVWYFMTACVGYSVVNNLRGKKPDQIPFISNAAEMAVGPF